jgi:L-asparaginase II
MHMNHPHSSSGSEALPENPVLVRLWRGGFVESQHRGAWCLVDSSGAVMESSGEVEHLTFVRSCIKSLQALPLIEEGAASALDFSEEELCLALASHNAEACHTGTVGGLLSRLDLSVDDLQCGPHDPGDREVRAILASEEVQPTSLHNNCSGKHAGFLALSRHLGVPTEEYLKPDGVVQSLVRSSIAEMCDLEPASLSGGIDGCSAPTYRLPLRGLAQAFARIVDPSGLSSIRRAACEEMTAAVAKHPILIAGSRGRLCTELSRVTAGRIFPKIGAEGVYALGDRSTGRALALKVEDGGRRGLHAIVVELLIRFEFLSEPEGRALASWRGQEIKNYAGLSVGKTEVML